MARSARSQRRAGAASFCCIIGGHGPEPRGGSPERTALDDRSRAKPGADRIRCPFGAGTAQGIGIEQIAREIGLGLGVRNQVFLGSEGFAETMLQRVPKNRDLRELPQARQRPPAKSLADYVRENPERNDAIVAAYRSGGYTLRDIGDFFSLHYSRISKIIQAADSARREAKGKT